MRNYRPEKSWQNDPDDEMDSLNPFVNARNHGNMTQTNIAEALQITPLKVMRIEQGTIDPVPKPIVDWYKENLKLIPMWEPHYAYYRETMRRCAPRPAYGVPSFPRGPINFRRWRQYNWPTLSQVGWAKAFCVNPASVYRLETPDTMGIVTQEMILALEQSGVFTREGAEQFSRTLRVASDHS